MRRAVLSINRFCVFKSLACCAIFCFARSSWRSNLVSRDSLGAIPRQLPRKATAHAKRVEPQLPSIRDAKATRQVKRHPVELPIGHAIAKQLRP
eukprot:9420500-Pyramimonas_sp.AAC.1